MSHRFLAVLWRTGWLLLMVLGTVLVGAAVPFLAGMGGYGFGAYLALSLSCGFACWVAVFRPRSAILFVALFTGTTAAVNYWGRTAYEMRGAGDLTVFWGIWGILLASSLPGLGFGSLVGWLRLRKLRKGNSSAPPTNPAELSSTGRGLFGNQCLDR